MNLGLESSLTLRRLLVWTYDPKIRLKTLAALVDHCQGLLSSSFSVLLDFSANLVCRWGPRFCSAWVHSVSR